MSRTYSPVTFAILDLHARGILGTRLPVVYRTVAALLLNLRRSEGREESCNPSISYLGLKQLSSRGVSLGNARFCLVAITKKVSDFND